MTDREPLSAPTSHDSAEGWTPLELCSAILDWLEEQGYSPEDADAILRVLIDRADKA